MMRLFRYAAERIIPMRRGYGHRLRHGFSTRAQFDRPPPYEDIFQHPHVEYISSPPDGNELAPPNYETAIQLPPVYEFLNPVPTPVVVPTLKRMPTRRTSQCIDAQPHCVFTQSPRRASSAIPSPTPPKLPSPEKSDVRVDILDSTNPSIQLNGEVTNSAVGGHNRSYLSAGDATSPRSKKSLAICTFIIWVLFTSTMIGLLVYLHCSHPTWMPQWALILLACLLTMSLFRHVPALLRE